VSGHFLTLTLQRLSGFWGEKKEADVTATSDRRRVIIDFGRASQADADDLRVEHIATQLEEAEQQRSPTTGSNGQRRANP
jgi:hypothetical protein